MSLSENKPVHTGGRPSWDIYFMKVAYLVCERATCLRRKVGAVLVKDRQILATGYNGAPMGIRHCEVTGCLRLELGVPSGERHEICRGLHAEQNVLLQAARHGISVRDSVLYITNAPCIICAKMIVNAGIKEVIIADSYPDKMALDFLKEAKIGVRRIKKKI
ncbi:MAG: cytidine deaminase [Candidatus Omnitrophica bacterium]|nr:cytidine deaminase [Candidatus Omnitrophota bacterium]MBD3269301.1 cytidine deaminase [Candidatus Omnitrophota bacterium]